MDYSEIKMHVNMRLLLESYGVELDKNNRCQCPIHGGENKTAFSVSNDLQTWNCHTKCGGGGDIFTFIEKKEGCNNPTARIKIMEMFALEDMPEQVAKPKPQAQVKSKQSHIYRDKDGEELYRVNRVDYDDGSKQCYQECNGKRTLPKDVRTLYNYDKIYGSTDYIILCEGEKTADAVTECGYIGTTNPLGSKSWSEDYAKLLEGMKVVLMPDADEHGEKWRDEVLATLKGKVEQVQVVEIPAKFVAQHPEYSGHDFADMVESYSHEKAEEWLRRKLDAEPVLERGYDMAMLGRPIDGFRELKKLADAGIRSDVLNLNEWLPSFDLVANKGDLIVIMANTGVGKTRALHNVPYHIKSVNYAMFDLELSFHTLCERYGAMANGISVRDFKERLLMKRPLVEPNVSNVFIQKVERLTVDKIRDRVDELEQLSQQKIQCVSVDYIGLMSGQGGQYEVTTENVEAFKAYISDTNRVGLLSTQVSRPADKESGMFECPTVFSAKNSGSVENSAQILLGLWRPTMDKREMAMRCLKYSHGEYPAHEVRLIADDLLIEEPR